MGVVAKLFDLQVHKAFFFRTGLQMVVLFPKLIPQILIDTYHIAGFLAEQMVLQCLKHRICFMLFPWKSYNPVSTWHSTRHIMDTQQNLN